MKLLLNNRERKNKNHIGKEVKRMKRICALIIATVMIFVTGPYAIAVDGTITKYDQTIHVNTEYNAYGVAVNSTSKTTTTTTTTDEKGGTSTTTTVTTVTSTYHGGSLKADTAYTVSDTTSSDGSTSKTDSTDTYVYSNTGNLLSVSGSGTMESYDGESKHKNEGTITRTYTVKDGQALLAESKTAGTIKDKNSKQIGTFTNTTTIAEADYQYLGGSWVPMKETSVSTSNMTTDENFQLSETVTRVTTYTRNSAGVITGINQTASGTRTVVTGNNGASAVASQTFTLQNYVATATFDSQMGWYISKEDYDWVLQSEVRNPAAADPALYGEIVKVSVNGVDYIGIRAELIDILDGNGLKNAEGEVWILTGDLAKQLKDYIGKKVMVMGDVAGQIGDNFVLNIRQDYGGGIVTENVKQNLVTYQQQAWYNNNLSTMLNTWSQVQAQFGSHSTWRQGAEFLMRLFGLGL